MKRFVGRSIFAIGVLAMATLGTNAQALEISRISVSEAGVEGNGWSSHPSVSANGRFVLFQSDASNLVTDDGNGVRDLFVRDLLLGRMELVSIAPNGGQFQSNGSEMYSAAQDGSISANGDLVLFTRNDECPSAVYLRDRAAGQTSCVNVGAASGGVTDYAISADGKWIAVSNANGVFLLDRISGTVTPVGVGAESYGDISLSADGGVLAFVTTESALDDVGNSIPHYKLFTFERSTGNILLVDSNPYSVDDPSISGDGRILSFELGTPVSDPVAGDSIRTDIWVLDRATGVRELITQSPAGEAANGRSDFPKLNHDGRFITFDSRASNLSDPVILGDPEEPGRGFRVYFFDRQTRQMVLITKVKNGLADVRVDGANPSISGDGRFVAFRSTAGNLVLGDTNESEDTFLWDRFASSGAPISLSAAAVPSVLWPPNKRLVNVAISTQVTGANGAVALSLRVEDEYGLLTRPDVSWSGGTVQLEAWRRGDDVDGRVYTIVVQATDASGQRATARTRVIVPHDQRRNGK